MMRPIILPNFAGHGHQSQWLPVNSSHGHVVTRSTRHRSTRHTSVSSGNWTLRLRDISPTRHFTYNMDTSPTGHFTHWTVHLRDSSPTRHFAYDMDISPTRHFATPSQGFPRNDLRKIFSGCQRMAKVPNAVEILPKIWTAWVGRTSSRSLKIVDNRPVWCYGLFPFNLTAKIAPWLYQTSPFWAQKSKNSPSPDAYLGSPYAMGPLSVCPSPF